MQQVHKVVLFKNEPQVSAPIPWVAQFFAPPSAIRKTNNKPTSWDTSIVFNAQKIVVQKTNGKKHIPVANHQHWRRK
jgi:hypothetical protein